MHFSDRRDAGKKLAAKLGDFVAQDCLVLGLARGGVEVAAEIARELNLDLDVLVARKIGAPWQPEFGIGAVAPDGTTVFDPATLAMISLPPEELEKLAEKEAAEVRRRLEEYRGGKPPLNVAGRCVILVDDGLATGITALAAARYIRKLSPSNLVFAVPVCSSPAAALLEPEVDRFVCLLKPAAFYAVGQWYRDFDQTSDEEVRELLQSTAKSSRGGFSTFTA